MVKLTGLLFAWLLVAPPARAHAQDMFAPLAGDAAGVVLSAETGRPIPFSLVLLATRDSALTYPDTAYLGYTGQFSPSHISAPVWVAAAACPGAPRSAVFLMVPRPHGDTLHPLVVRVSSRGCPPVSDEREYRGHYTGGFEASDFVPCGGEGRPETNWWVELLPQARAGVHWGDGDDVGNAFRYYVRWRGVLSPPGRYGHMSAGTRQLAVTRVLEVHRPTPGDCEPLTAQQPELVRLAQRVPVSSLDSTFPAVPLGRWLAQVGHLSSDSIRWEVNDCGEGGDGLAAPTCVEAALDLAPGTTASASLIVAGTDGTPTTPAVWMLYATTGASTTTFKRLPDWVAYVRRFRK